MTDDGNRDWGIQPAAPTILVCTCADPVIGASLNDTPPREHEVWCPCRYLPKREPKPDAPGA